MNEITNLFSNFLFPVALIVLFLYFFKNDLWPECKKFLERITNTLDKVTETNKSLSKTNEILAEKLEKKIEGVSTEVKDMSNKLDFLIEKE